MPNGIEHPFAGEEYPQEIQRLLQQIAPETAAVRQRHNNLDYVRSRLKDSANPSRLGSLFGWAGSDTLASESEKLRTGYWRMCQNEYVDWMIANDGDFWTTLHDAVA
jgi:hypothetical protein